MTFLQPSFVREVGQLKEVFMFQSLHPELNFTRAIDFEPRPARVHVTYFNWISNLCRDLTKILKVMITWGKKLFESCSEDGAEVQSDNGLVWVVT